MPDINVIVVDYAGTLSNARYCREGPPDCAGWEAFVDEVVFGPGSTLLDPWMEGRLTYTDIAAVVAERFGLPVTTAAQHMRDACRGLPLNACVMQFVEAQRAFGRRTALVTCNVDLFTEIVAPDQRLDTLFDVIVNSADYGTADKRDLWPIAFAALGTSYETAFALDDNPQNVQLFVELGGRAYRYTGDEALRAWLRSQRDL